MKTTLWLALVGVVGISAPRGLAQRPPGPVPRASDLAQPGDPGSASLSPGAVALLKLANSGVSGEVMLGYVQNATTRFNLSPESVLYLKDVGISSRVIKAMLNRDSVLMGRGAYRVAAANPAMTSPPSQLPTARRHRS